LACIGLTALVLTVGACDDSTAPFVARDFAMLSDGGPGVTDGGGGNDMSMMKAYMTTTVNAYDTGTLADGTAIRITGLVVITPVDKFFARSSATCRYEVWAQDPQCSTPPCGLSIQVNGMTLPVMDAGSSSCPSASKSGTPLAGIMDGNTVDVAGVTKTYTDRASGIKNHVIFADSITASATQGTITPTVLTNVTANYFKSGAGAEWTTYEGMYIKLQPAGGLTISSIDTATPYHFHSMPGNSDWADTFRFDYSDGGDRTTVGTMYTSMAGVVNTDFGGSLLPTQASDLTK
jgi:hypothetical protein